MAGFYPGDRLCRQKLSDVLIIAALGCIFLALSACSGSNSGSAKNAGQLAAQGKTVYEEHCLKCHGENGQNINGSALMGPGNVLPAHQDGQQLYDYIRQQMPDDSRGSLTPAQYLEVESYLLVQDGFVKPNTAIDPNHLDQISLEP